MEGNRPGTGLILLSVAAFAHLRQLFVRMSVMLAHLESRTNVYLVAVAECEGAKDLARRTGQSYLVPLSILSGGHPRRRSTESVYAYDELKYSDSTLSPARVTHAVLQVRLPEQLVLARCSKHPFTQLCEHLTAVRDARPPSRAK